jgi:ferredoxin
VKVLADIEKCEGYANCIVAAPTIFSIDDDNIVLVLEERPAEDQREAVEEAVRNCPVAALSITED